MRDMIRHRRNENLSLHRGNALEGVGNPLRALAVIGFHGGVVLGEEPVHGGHQADYFFFGDFHPAAHRIRVRRIVFSRGLDQVLSSQQQAGTLRTAQAFTSRKCDQVKSHLGVVPQVRNWGNIGSRVVETGHAVLVRHPHPVFAVDVLLSGVEEVCHHRAVIEGLLVLLERFHFHKAHSAIADGVVIVIAMRLLHDDFIFQTIHVGRDAEDVRVVAGSNASGGPQRKRRRGPGRDQGAFAAQSLGEVLARGLVQFNQVDGMQRRQRHRRLHFVRHRGRSQRGVGPGRINEGSNAQLLVIVHALHLGAR